MKYIYFLLKLRRTQWHLTLLYTFLLLSITANTFLAYKILQPSQTIFIPTTTGDTFVFDGSFTPLYFERMAEFLSQKWLSFYPNQNIKTLNAFLCPLTAKSLLEARRKFLAPYTDKHIQGFFSPEKTQWDTNNTLRLQGGLKLFARQTFMRNIPIVITIMFRVEAGQCFMTHFSTRISDSPTQAPLS